MRRYGMFGLGALNATALKAAQTETLGLALAGGYVMFGMKKKAKAA